MAQNRTITPEEEEQWEKQFFK